mmetsp:Transcript_40301/g.83906  ORF Transcript_40301/g.83906 Transcript_40301/m.83906 type:complete len:94 (-) Transcript_40301:336-617(-)
MLGASREAIEGFVVAMGSPMQAVVQGAHHHGDSPPYMALHFFKASSKAYRLHHGTLSQAFVSSRRPPMPKGQQANKPCCSAMVLGSHNCHHKQ